MDIIIAGVGKIGLAVTATLVKEGHDVTVIDKDPDIITDVTNIYDVMGVCGNCADCETLQEAGAEKAARIANRTLTKAKKKVGLLLG